MWRPDHWGWRARFGMLIVQDEPVPEAEWWAMMPPGPLYRQVRRRCPADADGVPIAGTGFRAVAVIAALEEDLGRPVVAANQASLWHCLRIAGVRAPVAGYGRLFEC